MALNESQSPGVGRTVGFVREFVDTFRRAHVSFLAGSIAYAAFVSLLPFLVLVVLIASVLGGEEFVSTVIGLTETYLSPAGQDLLTTSLEQATARAGLSILSIAVFLWAALRLFRSLDLAFSLLYGTEADDSLLGQLTDGLIVLGAMTVAVAGMVAVTVLLSLVGDLPYASVVGTLFLVVFLIAALFPIYYVFPDHPLTLGEVLPGTIVAAIGWAILEAGFGLYVGLTSTQELYGVVGGVLLFVTWLYFGALVLLIGATVNVVVTDRVEPGTIEPTAH